MLLTAHEVYLLEILKTVKYIRRDQLAQPMKRRYKLSEYQTDREIYRLRYLGKLWLDEESGDAVRLPNRKRDEGMLAAIADLRNEYKPGQELTARLTAFTDSKPELSVKEVNPNPFDGAELRHPVGSRRQAVIQGKYAGGIFCCLPDDTTCLCLYSSEHFDAEFDEGNTVLVHITRYDYHKKLIYGRIVSNR